MRTEQRQHLGKLALPMAIAAGTVMCIAAAVIWVKQAQASSSASSHSAGSTLSVPNASAPHTASATHAAKADEALQDYANSCERAVRERRFDQAIELCQGFTKIESLAPKAYASMAVASMLREGRASADQWISAKHAEQAAKLKDPLGQMILAFHSLNGYTSNALPAEQIEALLLDAQRRGVDKANLLLDDLKQAQSCREKAKVQLFEQPLFCMSRGELRAALKALGLREQEERSASEREVFLLGDLLPGARQMSLQYVRELPSYLIKPAALSYRFSHADAVARQQSQQRISEGLRKKYGAALRAGDGETPALWRTSDGIEIELRREGLSDLMLSYQLPQRVKALREQTLAHEQKRQERLSAQMLKAI